MHTDAQGRFRIEGLPPGRYKPTASAPGRLGMAESSVTLGIGETDEELLIRLRPAPIVAGTITIAGSDEPCRDGIVGLIEEKMGRAEWQWSNSEGRVIFSSVLPGRYRPMVYCEGYRSSPMYPVIDAGGRSATDLSWTVSPSPGIVGVVTGAAGPAAGATVLIERTDAVPPFQRALIADARGRFELEGLEPGTYEVSAGLDGQATGASTKASVGDESAEVSLQLGAAGTIRGIVVDADQQPVAAAVVELRAARASRTVRTDEAGAFALTGLPWRRYEISATVDGSHAPHRSVELGAGEPDEELTLEIDADSGKLQGRVVDESGMPAPDVLVGPAGFRGATSVLRGVAMSGSTVLTAPDGTFVLEGLPQRKHEIVAVGTEGSTASVSMTPSAEPTPLEIVLPSAASAEGRIVAPGIELPTFFAVRATGPDSAAVVEMFSNDDGSWSLDGLPPGPVNIAALTSAGRAAADIELEPGEHRTGVQLELMSRIDVEGTIVDIDTKEPLEDWVTVAVAYEDGWEELGKQAEMAFGIKPGDPRQISDGRGKFVVPAQTVGVILFAAFPKGYPETEHGAIRTTIRIPVEGPLELLAPHQQFEDPNNIGSSGLKLRRGDYDQPWTVERVDPDGPAAGLDVQPDDQIVEVNGYPTTGVYKYLARAYLNADVGKKVRIGFARGSTIEVTLAPRPDKG